MNLLKFNYKLGIVLFLGYFAKEVFVGLYREQSKQLPKKRFGEGTRDKVDEASWESFPASDPPAFY